MKLYTTLLFLCLSLIFLPRIANSQINCNPSVPNGIINLNSTFSSDLYPFIVGQNGSTLQCCNQATTYECRSFTINTSANANAIIIKLLNHTGNYSININDCNTTLTSGQVYCITGGNSYQVSVCSDASTDFIVQFESIGSPTLTGATSATVGCTGTISILGFVETSITVNSTNPGAIGDYNNLIDCTTGCSSIGFTPINTTPATVTYQICGNNQSAGCTGTNTSCQTITLGVNPPISASIDNSFAVCQGNSFTINSTANGGLAPLNYLWSGPAYNQSQPAPNTSSITTNVTGTYALTIMDAAGCSTNPALTVDVNPVLPPNVTAGADHTFCAAQNSVSLTGGSSPGCTLLWSGGSGSFTPNPTMPIISYNPDQTELTAGTIVLTLTATNLCGTASDNMSITFASTNGIQLTGAVTDITCFGASTGAIDLTVTGGSGNYTYSWNNGATTEDISGLAYGSYTVTVNDLTLGCSTNQTFNVNQPSPTPPFNVTIAATQISCYNGTNGALISNLINGSSPFTYQWSGASSSTNPNLSPLGPGVYNLQVTDGNGCIANASSTLTNPSQIILPYTQSNVVCNGESNGSIDVSSSGGTGSLTFNWTPINVTSEDLTGLGSGTYVLTATDANSCTNSVSVQITQPNALAAQGNITHVTCYGANNGSIVVTPSGGNGVYSYLWTPGGATSQNLTSIAGGLYSLVLTDGNNCSGIFSFQVNEPSPINLSASLVNPTCNGLSDGQINLTVSGGTSPNTYLWSGPGNFSSTSEDLSTLSSGTYTVTVTDAAGCTSSSSFSLVNPSAISATSSNTNINCNGGSTGAINLTPAGGDGSYTFLWSNSATTEDLSGLTAGTYSVTITDGNGCTGSFSTSLTQAAAITATSSNTNINCNGGSTGAINLTPAGGDGSYTFLWSNSATTEDLSGLTAGTYSVTITDGNGCTGSFSTSLTQAAAITATSSNTNINCNGGSTGAINLTPAGGDGSYTFLWSNSATTEDLSGLTAGTYSVTITDGNGCTGSFSTSLTQAAAITATSSNTNINCNGGSTGAINLTPAGGDGSYTFLWSNNATTEDLSGLTAGTYSVTITDGNGCTGSFSTSLTQAAAITATSSNTNINCNGGSTGAINLTPAGGDGSYTFLWSNNATTEDLSGLTAGTYSVTITDGNGCTGSFSTSLTQAAAITATSSNTNINCNGGSTGAINLTPAGGDGSYTFLWSNNATTEDLSGLTAGTYSVTITDGNGCTGSFSTSLTQAAAITATSSNTNINCNGGSTGAINLTPAGGDGSYTFLWSNNATTEDLSGLTAGTYSVTITDGNGCTGSFSTSLTQAAAITATSSNTNINCNGGSTGAINLTPAGGDGSYTFLWSNNATTEDLSGLTAGTYSVTITDGNGCTGSFSTSLTQAAAITATSSNTNINCNGGSTGAINLTPAGGDGSYTFLWSNNATTEDLSGLTAGTYSVTITDGNGCTGSFSTSLTQAAAITATSSNTNINCNGGSTGAINLTPAGGDGSYTFLWSNNATTEDLSGLTAGTYSVTITDGNGCTGSFSTSLTQAAAITATSSNTNINCNGGSTGAINLTPAGGDGSYTFLWSNNATTEDLSGLTAGTYSVTITDGNGCTGSFSTSLTQAAAITATSSNTNINCNGGSTGAINLTPAGGDGSYTFLWSNNATTEDLSGLTAGTYSVTITDGNGCTGSFSTSLTQAAAITATSSNTNINCNGGSTGAINLTPAGGDGSYTFLWSNNATTEDLSGLTAGTYSVTITDGNGCTGSFSTSLTQAAAITATSSNTNINCNGGSTGAINLTPAGGDGSYTFLWSNNATTEDLSGLTAGTYSVTITDGNGCTGSFSTSLTQAAAITATSSNTNINCNGGSTGAINLTPAGGDGSYTFLWSNNATTEDLSGLTAGTYSVTITDGNGCTGSFSTSLTQAAAITATSSNTNINCNGGSTGAINLTPAGGDGSYTFLWSNNATTEDLSGLTAGTYSVTITDGNGCTGNFNSTISQPTPLQLSSAITNVLCNGNSTGAINLSVVGGTSPYSFIWSNSLTTEDISNLSAGNYSVTVTDNNGCVAQLTSTVTQPQNSMSASSTVSNIICNGAATGAINLTVTGGSSPYNFSWSNGATTEDLTNLAAGTYTVTINDNNNCSIQSSIIVSEPTAISITSSNTNILCSGAATGAIDLTVSGGTPGYTFTWSNNANTEDLNSIGFGTYSVTVIDNNGCAANYSTFLSQAPQLTLTKQATNVLCNGGTTGAINITVSGGVPPYSFSWNNGATTEDLNGIPAGNYTLTVTDNNGCTASTAAVVTEPAALSISSTSTPASCQPDGSASVTVSGGTVPYTYLWSNNATTSSINNIAAGTYSVVVTDSNGCTANASVVVGQTSGLTATATINTPIACNGGSALVDVVASGGTAPYTGDGQFTVAAGNQSFTVTDANGCSVVASILVTEPTALTASYTIDVPIACNGDLADLTIYAAGGTAPYIGDGPQSGYPAGTYSFNVADDNSCITTISITLVEPTPLATSLSTTNVSCANGTNGAIDITISGGTPGYTFQWSNNAVTEDISSIPAGNYSVHITDANGCIINAATTISQPNPLILTTSSTPSTCNPTGTASVNATGGTAPFTYLWSNNATTSSINNIAAGTYSVTLTDANGCTANASVVVGQTSGLTATATINTPIACNGDSALVDVVASGGTAPYSGDGQFTVAAGNQSFTVTDANGCSVVATILVTEPTALTASYTVDVPIACNGGAAAFTIIMSGGTAPYYGDGPQLGFQAGTYSFNVADDNSCITSISVTITEPTPLALAVSSTNVSCANGTNGAIDITISGGTPGYTFQWSNNAVTEDISSIPAGNYSVHITDANGCIINAATTISQPNPLILTTSSTPSNCNPTGTASVSAAGGTLPYTYLWSNNATTSSINNIAAGTYSVVVTDSNGCTANASVVVGQTSGLSASIIQLSPILCNGDLTTVDISATGGTPPYSGIGQYQVNAGVQNFTVYDATGCSVVASITITEPAPLVGTYIETIPILCTGGAADIDISGSGGTPPYVGTGPVSGLTAGTYTFNIADDNSCISTVNVVITEPDPILLSGVVTDALCNGSNDGAIDLTVIGGTPGYFYQWNNGDPNEDPINLTAGNYSVTVLDVNSCSNSINFTVNEPTALSASISSTPASCIPDGTATVVVNGGTAPYGYFWSNGGTTSTITGLAAGNYNVTIVDANNCSMVTAVNVSQSGGMTATAIITTPISCNGGNATVLVSANGGTAPYSGTGSFSSSAGTQTYSVSDANGCVVTATLTINEPTLLVASSAILNAIQCNGGNATVQVSATGGTSPYLNTGNYSVLAGTHTYTVTDANGCTSNTSITVNQPGILNSSSSTVNVTCNGANTGSATVNATGGTAPYIYLWSNNATSATITNVAAGTYTVTTTDANGCTSNSSATITQPTAINLTTSATPASCNPDGSASVSATGGNSPYTYSWSNGGTTATINGLNAGTYTVAVTDATGCTSVATVQVPTSTGLTATSSITNPILCNGGNANITVSATGGTAPYSGTGTFIVSAGTYNYTVTDANGCSSITNLVVTEPSALSVAINATNVTCNGANNGSLTAVPTGGINPYTYSWSNGVTTAVNGNLAPGNYTVAVTDVNGCIVNGNGTITQPSVLQATSTVTTPITCFGGNATINVSANGGSLPYTGTGSYTVQAGIVSYTVTDANGCTSTTSLTVNQPTQLVASAVITTPITVNGGTGVITVSGNGGTAPYAGTGTFTVNAGTYTYTVTDANGCTSTVTITITEPNALSANSTLVNPILCFGGQANINVSATGGIAPYTGTGTFNVSAGTYTYTVTDAGNGSTTTTITVTEPTLLTSSISSTDVNCNGAANGTASVTASGGTLPYTYLWSNNATSSSISNLSPGLYTVTVTDANGCTTQSSVTISEPAALVASSAITNPVLCFGGAATITVSAVGGVAAYTGTGTFAVNAGTYNYTVTDANGCTSATSITVTDPTLLTSSISSSNVTCNGTNDGSATVTGNGGTLPYTYTWTNSATTATVSSLSPGNYSVTITDANGCSSLSSITITQPSALVAQAVLTSPILCFGGTATVTVTGSGGTVPYSGVGVNTVNAGTYNYTVSDANGCSTSTSITVIQPAQLSATTSSVNVTCNGANNGSGSVNVTGGTVPYTYSWSNNATTSSINNLSPGTYTVTVTDANGCNISSSITITEPSILQATSTVTTPILCNGGNAVVTVAASGGTAPYTGIGNFTAAAGLHTYNITDANGCTTSTSITVTEPPALTSSASSTNLSCNGSNNGTATVTANGGTAPYTYLWSNGASTQGISNLSPGPYAVTVTDANGCTTQSSVSITQPAILTAASSITSAILCNGGNATVTVTGAGGTLPYTGTGSFSVVAGTYNYTVTDANGCIAQTSITVTQPTALSASSAVTQPIACFGGTAQVTISATGGTLPYIGTGIQTVLTGVYNYTVTDGNGCTTTTSINVSQPTQLTVNVVGTNPLCNGNANGSAQANVSGGTVPYSYSWSNGNQTALATNLGAGSYTVTVTDANGCTITGNVTLSQPNSLVANSVISSPILCFAGTGQVSVNANGGTLPYTGIGAYTVVAGVSSYTVTDANGCSASTSINVPQPSQLIASSSVASTIACFGGTGNIIVTAVGGTPAYIGTGTFTVTAGPHTYTVTDANGCANSTTITITQPPALTPSAVITSPILCNGGSAVVNVSAVGGTPAYSGTGNFIALAGVHSYTVIDANGCSASVSINVSQPTVLTSSISSQNVTCNGLNNGAAVVTPVGGTPNYTYLWNTGATTASITNLAPGAYSVTVTDANGCQSVSNVIISQPTTLTSSVVQTSNVLCFGGTGTVFVSANGGTAPYAGLGTFTVTAGTQFFTVTDANGCTSTSSILITQPTQLNAAVTQTSPILCFGGQAVVSVTGTGGTGAYTGTGSFNVFAGTNSFTIQDANGCAATTSIIITQPTAVTAQFTNTNITCFGFTNGASTVAISGGTPGYTYLWSTGSTSTGISGQPAGNYSIQVTDANGCINNFNTTLTQPAQVVSTANIVLPIACFGGQAIVLVNGAGGTPPYSGNGTFFEYAGTYVYTLTDQNGCTGTTTLVVPQPAPFIATATVTVPIACNGGQATVVVTGTGGTAPYTGTGTFVVSAGTYTYTLIDANGCSATTTITVTQPAALLATATIISPILCNGGSAQVQVTASGGSVPYSGTGTFTVVSGTYNYLVTDANGCSMTTSIAVPQPPLLVTNVVPTNVTCFGANNGSAIVFNSGGTAPLSILWSNGSTSNSISGLAPGNYSVAVTDANGCQNINPFTITQPNTLVASVNQISPILCFNGNATVVVSATGGTSPYSGTGTFFPIAGNYIYTVTDAQGCTDTASIVITQPTQLTAVATILSPVACFGGQAQVNISASGGVAPYIGTGNFTVSAGNQSFTVTDANGCAYTVTINITQPAILFTTISATNVTCFNAGNGTATINPIGGTPGYQYLWSNGGTSQTINNLTPGLYSATVTDANGCQATNQITITQPTALVANAALSSPVFCFGGNAVVSVSANGGTPSYIGTGNFNQAAGTTMYYVTDANGCVDSIAFTVVQPPQLIATVVQTSNVLCFGGTATVNVSTTGGTPAISGTGNFTVSAGWNNFTVTDNYGCQDTTSIYINQPTLLVANSTLVAPVLCNGGTAVINISASGGTPTYTGIGNLTVVAGTYTYTVTDANGCTATTSITVTQPNPIQAVATITSPIVCNAGTGVITVTGVGGTAPYTGTGSFTVPAGTYTYTIIDASGCSSSVTITITQPPVLTLSLTQTNVNCNGFATGSITANPAGGQGPYTYQWSNTQTSQTITNLLAGSYSVVVTDNLGCTVSGNTTITQPLAPILLQESHVNVLCFGNNTGSINLSVSGGTSPYTYSWSNGPTTQDIQNLIAGTYNVTVTDANGCTAVMSVNITQPAFPLTVGYVVTNVSCFGYADGAIDVTPQGGTGPFTYFWTSGQTTQDLNNIPPGQYIVAITDANNCVSSAQITVTQPLAPLSATITQVPISCYNYNDGQLTANAVGGTSPYSYVWTPTGQTGSIASSLAPGTYIVNITDANGCTTTATDVLGTPAPFIASFTVSDNVVCLPSTVSFTNTSIGNFSTALWTFSNGLSYTSNQFTVAFNTLGCVDVTLLITNSNGCTSDTTISNAVCVVPGPTAAFTTATPEIDFVTGGIDFINNSQNYTGSIWQFGDGGTSNLDNPSYFYPASTIADYNVMLVVYDANGCTDTAYSVVQSNDVIRLTVPNAFTPNGDGLNDLFTPIISNSDQVKYYHFEVYNRWGQIVFESNKPGEGWDGKYNGKLVQFGTYNWKVSYDVPDQDSVNANGHVTIVK